MKLIYAINCLLGLHRMRFSDNWKGVWREKRRPFALRSGRARVPSGGSDLLIQLRRSACTKRAVQSPDNLRDNPRFPEPVRRFGLLKLA